jgi:energy-coupling factor transport system ATP-binding protein
MPEVCVREQQLQQACVAQANSFVPQACAVEMRAVSFAYGEGSAPCVEGIDLAIREGECVLLVGASGCGKTTLTRMMNGLIPHFYEGTLEGSVLVGGLDTEDLQPDGLASLVGSVFQNPRSQFFNLDTTSEIAFGCENRGLDSAEIRRRVDTTASVLGITRLLDRDIFALSGGEKQLVALASAHALGPHIYVLDEPSSNLDPRACRQLAGVLARLKSEGATIVIAEHRLHYLEGIYDRVVLLKDGSILREWSAEVFTSLSAQETERLGLRASSLARLASKGMRAEGERPEDERADNAHTENARPGSIPADATQAESEKRSESHSPRLRVRGLTAGYRHGQAVLKDVCFDVAPGEIIGIIGSNGEGKSTLARVLCGLHRESAGTIELDGRVLNARRRPGLFNLVMQEPGYQLFTNSVVGELRLARDRGSAPTEHKVDATLAALDLSHLRDCHPMSLSGGERQRTAIGAALAHNAAVLVLDEPTSGLDLANMHRVVEVLNGLKERGQLLLLITHDYELLRAVCTRVLVLEDGHIVHDLPLNARSLARIRHYFD